MRHGQSIAGVLVVVAGVIVIGAGVHSANGGALPTESASPSVSATPTATPQPVAKPASAALVGWAIRWRRAAVRSWTKWNRARWCLAMSHLPFASPRPARRADKARWMKSGRHWRHMQRSYRHRFGILWGRMNDPHGNAWERWRPLVRWVWPARCVNTVIEIIHWESGGQEYVWNHGGSGAFGLMQLLPKPSGVWTAREQLEYAHHHKYIPAGGWSPWAGCRAFD